MWESFREAARLNPMLAIAFAFTLYFLSQVILVPLLVFLVGAGSGLGMDTAMDIIQGNQLDLPGATAALRWINGGNGVLSWGVPAILMAMFLGAPRKVLSLDQQPRGFAILMAVLLMVVCLPIVQLITFDSASFELPAFLSGIEQSMKEMETRATALLMRLLGDVSTGALLANIVVFALIPAVCEELFFRGFVQQKLSKVVNPHAAIWITAAIFSLMHLQFYGFFGRLFLGALLGYLLYRSGSLWPSIIAHFTYNLINVIVAWGTFKYGWTDQEMLESAPEVPWTLWLPAVVIFGGLFYLFWKKSERREQRSESRDEGQGI